MLNIEMRREGTTLTVHPEGAIDTITSSQLEEALEDQLDGVEKLLFDFSDVEYISSAGLRVLLKLHKEMEKKGGMKIMDLTEEVRDTLEIVGLLDFLSVE